MIFQGVEEFKPGTLPLNKVMLRIHGYINDKTKGITQY